MSSPDDPGVGEVPDLTPADSVTPGPGPAAVRHDVAAGGRIYWGLSLGVVAVDQVAKAMVRAWLPLFESATLIPGFADLTHVHNTGVAFGLLNDHDVPFKSLITGALAVGALLGIVYYARHVRREEWLARLGLSLILGGAMGNLIDRASLGYVVDFMDLYWGTWHFWAFNVADASITVGAILVFLDLLVVNRHASHPV
jgi:signal peptidase II